MAVNLAECCHSRKDLVFLDQGPDSKVFVTRDKNCAVKVYSTNIWTPPIDLVREYVEVTNAGAELASHENWYLEVMVGGLIQVLDVRINPCLEFAVCEEHGTAVTLSPYIARRAPPHSVLYSTELYDFDRIMSIRLGPGIGVCGSINIQEVRVPSFPSSLVISDLCMALWEMNRAQEVER